MSYALRLMLIGFAVSASVFAASPRTPAHGEPRGTEQLVSGCSVSHRLCYEAPENLGRLINTPQFDGGPSASLASIL